MMKHFAQQIAVFLLILFAIISCSTNQNDRKENLKQNDETKKLKNQIAIKQSENDLLGGVTQAVCYSGFRAGQHPDRGDGAVNPSYNEILEDLQILSQNSNFPLLRMYDSGENTEMTLQIIKENNIDIKVMLGIWLKAELSNHETCEWLKEPIPQEVLAKNAKINKEEIKRGIELANKYTGIIIAVNVGNEALVDWNDHKVDTDTIIAYCRKVKKAIKQQVTVAENYEWWAKKGANLAKELDFISVHIYPVWEGKDIDEGMSYSVANIQKVRDALPDSRIVISEAGWATIASEFGNRASEEKQMRYFNELMKWTKEMNITTFFFEAFDESWKGNPNNPMGAEKHWGLFTENRKPKKVMQELYPDL